MSFNTSRKVYLMEGITPILNLKNNYNTEFRSAEPAPSKPFTAQKDELKLSNKKQDNGSYVNILRALALTAAVISGGIYGGKLIYQKYFQKLACGVKKGEINDALYNFIKNNDPKGKLFNDKSTLIELNNGLTDEKLIILKQLAKMKKQDIFSPKRRKNPPRFTLSDIKSLLEEANEGNIKYLEQLAKKSEKHSEDRVKTFSPTQILKVLKCINKENEAVAKQLIDVTEIHSEEINRLSECLKNVNKENIDIWKILLSTRKKGSRTELSLENLSKLTKKIEKTQNPKCAEILLNAEKKNGAGSYVHDVEDILTILPELNEDNVKFYQKFYETNSVSKISGSKCTLLVPAINEHNINFVENLLSKTEKDSDFVIFNNYKIIKNILENIDNINKEVAQKLLSLLNSKYTFSGKFIDTDKNFLEVIKEIRTPEAREKAEKILNEDSIKSFETFVNRFFKHD